MVVLKNFDLFRSNLKTNVHVLYVLVCNNCDFFYTGQTEELKQRTQKHKSDIIYPNSSN